MRKWHWIAVILVTFSFSHILLSASQSQTESLLDHWTTRTEVRKLLLSSEGDPAAALSVVAKDTNQPVIRRQRALSLLATISTPASSTALREVANDSNPVLRCHALNSIVELEERQAIPVLVSKLDDKEVCLTQTVTDPGRSFPIYVSDEAVRHLEDITHQRFEKEVFGKHRATEPWKKWWSKESKSSH